MSMKLGGFALKKGRKKALATREQSQAFAAAAPVAPQAPAKVFVTDFDPSAPAALTADGQPPLVIPLIQTNEWQPDAEQDAKKVAKKVAKKHVKTEQKEGGADDSAHEPQTADERAAKLLLAEATRSSDQGAESAAASSTLVIPMNSHVGDSKSGDPLQAKADEAKAAKRAELFQDAAQRHQQDEVTRDGKQKAKPILQQNAVPGLDALADVTEKYRHDVALRPDAPDVHSEVYTSVPVEAFGAALLRGMGWKGSVDPDDEGEAPKPRHKLLGLGATKRPPMAGDDKRKKRNKKQRTEEKREEKEAPTRRSTTSGRRDERDTSRSSRSEKEDRSQSKRSSSDRPTSRTSNSERRRDEDRHHRRQRSRSRSRDGSRRRDRELEREREQSRDRGRDRDRDEESKRDRGSDDRRKSRRSRSRSRERDRRSSRR